VAGRPKVRVENSKASEIKKHRGEHLDAVQTCPRYQSILMVADILQPACWNTISIRETKNAWKKPGVVQDHRRLPVHMVRETRQGPFSSLVYRSQRRIDSQRKYYMLKINFSAAC
jgi:hypothetical protein